MVAASHIHTYIHFCVYTVRVVYSVMVQAQHEDGAVESTSRRMDSKKKNHESMIEVAAEALSPTLTPLQLLDINKIAARYQKDGECIQAVAAYRLLFDKARYRV